MNSQPEILNLATLTKSTGQADPRRPFHHSNTASSHHSTPTIPLVSKHFKAIQTKKSAPPARPGYRSQAGQTSPTKKGARGRPAPPARLRPSPRKRRFPAPPKQKAETCV